jgi:succinylarginine dihydrolase
VEVFAYGASTQKYPARQSLFASQAVARLHQLDPAKTIFLCQNPAAIDAGVFHNDVIAMSCDDVFIYHEKAYSDLNTKAFDGFRLVAIKESDLSLQDSVSTYFFNSQLVKLPEGVTVIAPEECHKNPKAKACFDRLTSEGIVAKVHYLDLRESMKNGGGPACLRLRAPLSQNEIASINSHMRLNDFLYDALCQWIEKYFRDKLESEDLYDPLLAKESSEALQALYKMLNMKAPIA